MSLDAFLETPPPRDVKQVATHVRAATRGYRLLALIIWAVVLIVPTFVGVTSKEGEKVFNLVLGLSMTTVMFGAPVTAFLLINRRKILRCLRSGVRLPARVLNIARRGAPGRKFDEVEVAIDYEGQTKRAFASGLVPPSLPKELDALYDPTAPDTIALVIPEMGLVVARVT